MKKLVLLIAIFTTSWQLLNAEDPDVLWTVDNTKPYLTTYECRFTPDNKFVIATTGKTITKYDALTGQFISRFQDTCDFEITKMALSKTCSKILTCDFPQHKLYVWDYVTEKQIKVINYESDTIGGLSGFDLSPDDKYALVGLMDKENYNNMILLNLDNYYEEKKFDVKGSIWEIAFSPDRKYFVTASLVYDTHYQNQYSYLYLWKTENWEFVQELGYLKYKIINIRFSNDGSKLACAVENDTLTIWDMNNRIKIKEYPQNVQADYYYNRAAFSNNKNNIVLSGYGSNMFTLYIDLFNDSLNYK